MKKKVIAVLLASMMATSMVPVTAMAEDQPDVVSAEETQDLSTEADAEATDGDFFAEESDVQESETEAPSEDVQEEQEADGEEPAAQEDMELEESEDADSLDLFELAMALEEEFSVEIPSEDLEKITTVADAMNYLTEHQA